MSHRVALAFVEGFAFFDAAKATDKEVEAARVQLEQALTLTIKRMEKRKKMKPVYVTVEVRMGST